MSRRADPDEQEPWRDLRVGDRIRIVRMPTGFGEDGHTMGEETEALYRHLIAERTVLAVTSVEHPDLPWIEYTWVQPDGAEVFHYLAVNDDSWERVR